VRKTVDDLFAEACSRIDRLDPSAAYEDAGRGALILDIRADDSRRRDGVVPGALHIPRTVLEWRVDPDSAWHNEDVGDLDTRLIVICEHGNSSALAASTLVELGFSRAADVVGGFAAWQEAGLPVGPVHEQDRDGPPGFGPRD